ncbi:uncharacterized protein LOC119987881 [Tripterygium wilfordii]|uniref:uncharacterized protein LOC119987881 n=1 Tax=Tripterygium wilfordii TaxID=458696 RepID=UPI0018F7ECEF|nr:uncharacterized protein LOC119987881 [Tripterygium wilfordii]
MNTLKKRLEGAKGKWAEELPGVLWSYRTTAKTPIGETPFSLVYGSEVVIPIELELPSARCQWISQSTNDKLLQNNLDTINELREEARVRTAIYQQKMESLDKLGKDPIRLGKLSDEERIS